jgi:hypothetical protein
LHRTAAPGPAGQGTPALRRRVQGLQCATVVFEGHARHFDVPHICILGLALSCIECAAGSEQIAVLTFLPLVERPHGVAQRGTLA